MTSYGATTVTAYGYNDEDKRTSCAEADGSTVSWGYDAAGHLTSEVRTGVGAYTRTYAVDATGNRTSQSINGVTTSFAYNADDELTGNSGGINNTYSYNANGERTNRSGNGVDHTLSYDYDGQLVQIVESTGTTSFAYDALGRRVSRTAGGNSISFRFDGNRVLLENWNGTTRFRYSYGNALYRMGVLSGSSLEETFFLDGLGSMRNSTSNSGSVLSHNVYEAFGQRTFDTGGTDSAYRFAATSGYRSDFDAGLFQVGARYYDPLVGRFLTRDTVLSEHPYVYCDADPVNKVDPTGHELALAIGGGAAAVGSGVALAPILITIGVVVAIGVVAWVITHEIIERRTPGADGGRSRHIIEREDGEAISVTHQVDVGGRIEHQHQTHRGKYGGLRRFPEEWIEHPTIGE